MKRFMTATWVGCRDFVVLCESIKCCANSGATDSSEMALEKQKPGPPISQPAVSTLLPDDQKIS